MEKIVNETYYFLAFSGNGAIHRGISFKEAFPSGSGYLFGKLDFVELLVA